MKPSEHEYKVMGLALIWQNNLRQKYQILSQPPRRVDLGFLN